MSVVDEVKARLDVVEYIGRVVQLQKAGRNFRGLCPFHNERTPSFHVFPDRGTWRCFGSCGEGGDIFTFVQKRGGLSFREALRELADVAGVQLSAEATQRRSRQEHLSAVMSAAVEFYQRQFREEDGEDARRYVYEQRGFTPETVDAFRMGWAPGEWRSLRDHLQGRGYTDEDAIAAGLLVESESGGQPYDRFRGRVTIPIADERGMFVAMGGRSIHGEEPKYLNSPQTELFDKSRTLYGLDLAGEAARASGEVVVVEGYMDVIGPWQAGFRNLVATMGTALTEHHAGLLRRFATRIVLAMDADSAGMAATERAGELLLNQKAATVDSVRQANRISTRSGIELYVAAMPGGKDPDEVTRNHPEDWLDAVRTAEPFPAYVLLKIMGEAKPETRLETQTIIERLRPVLREINSPIERATYIGRLARHLGVPEQEISDQLRDPQMRWNAQRTIADLEKRVVASHEDVLLALILRYPSLRARVRSLPADLFADALNREVFRRSVADEALFDEPDPGDPQTAHVTRLTGLRLPAFSEEEARKAAGQKIDAILKERLLQRQAAVSEEVSQLEKSMGANQVAEFSALGWRGSVLQDEADTVAQMVIEDLQLGLSLHRREQPRFA